MNLVLVGRDPWFTEPRRSLAASLRKRGHLVSERQGPPPMIEPGSSLVVIGTHDHGPPPEGNSIGIWTEQEGSSINTARILAVASYTHLLDIRGSHADEGKHIPAWVEDFGDVPDFEAPRAMPALFYGSMTPRRQEILQAITRSVAEISIPTRPIWGDEKRAALKQALAVLVIHAYDGPSHEGWRFAEAARDGALVVTETTADPAPWVSRLEFASADSKDLPGVLRAIVDAPQHTVASRRRAWERFKECATADRAAEKVERWLAA